MAALRILHVVPYYEHAWAYGGIPRAVTTVTRALARRGHHVTVCTTDAGDAHRRAPADGDATPGLAVHAFRNLSNALAYRYQLFLPLGLLRHVRSLCDSVDIAHLHACRNLPVAGAARALARAGIPYVLSPHGTAPRIERRFLAKRFFDASFGRHFLENATRILAVSEAERRQLEALGTPSARITVLPNAIDEREFEPPPDGARFRRVHGLGDGPLVLLLAKLTPRKRADLLIQAFRRLRTPDTRLVIAGSDMQSGATRELTRRDSRITSVGVLTGRERVDALAAASVLAYPSTDEVFGLVPIEALLAGTPVIVGNDSGAGEIIGRIGGGHIVPSGDVESLAGAIDSMLSDISLWQQRARTAALRARLAFGADAVAERFDALYHEVLGRHVAQDRRTA